jgi:hypothetical protein
MKVGFELEMKTMPVHLYEYAVVEQKKISSKSKRIYAKVICRRVSSDGKKKYTGRFWVRGGMRGKRVDTYNLSLFKMPIGHSEFLECKIDHRTKTVNEIDIPVKESGHVFDGAKSIRNLYTGATDQFPVCEIVTTPLPVGKTGGSDPLNGLAYLLNMLCFCTMKGDLITPERVKALLEEGLKKRHFHGLFKRAGQFEIFTEAPATKRKRTWATLAIGSGKPMTTKRTKVRKYRLKPNFEKKPAVTQLKGKKGWETVTIPRYDGSHQDVEEDIGQHAVGPQLTFGFDLTRTHALFVALLTDPDLFEWNVEDAVGTKVIRDVIAYVLRQFDVVEMPQAKKPPEPVEDMDLDGDLPPPPPSSEDSPKKRKLRLARGEISEVEGYCMIALLYLELCVAFQHGHILSTAKAQQQKKQGGVSVTKNVFPFLMRSHFNETARLIPFDQSRHIKTYWNQHKKAFYTAYGIKETDKLLVSGITFGDLVKSLYHLNGKHRELIDHMGGLFRVKPEPLFTKPGRKGPVIELRYMRDIELQVGKRLNDYHQILGQLNKCVQKLIGINTGGSINKRALQILEREVFKAGVGTVPYWRAK